MNGQTLYELYRQHQGKVADKWRLYLEEYERVFSGLRNRDVRLLEIGVQNGGSLEIWSDYFPVARMIVGCDIDPRCAQLEFEDPRITVVTGDANSDGAEAELIGLSSEFDILIDDGSHTSGDIIRSFARYFPHVANGGLYIIEDLHCGYWDSYGGGLFHPHSSVAFLKSLADILSFEHWGVEKTRADLLDGFRSTFGIDPEAAALPHVHSIAFVNSMCIVRKRSVAENRLGDRVIAGIDEPVTKGHFSRAENLGFRVEPQGSNPWSARTMSPVEELSSRLDELARQSEQLDELKARVRDLESGLRDYQGRLKTREAELKRLYQSRSWRLTLPLRKAWQLKNFNKKFYLAQNPDVAASGMDPYVHYERYGRNEGRLPRPPSIVSRAGPAIAAFRQTLRFEGGLLRSLRRLYSIYSSEGRAGVQGRVGIVLSQTLRNNYQEWIQRYDTLNDTDRKRLRAQISLMESAPLISILMPTYNTNIRWLKEAVDSVRRQLYERWELCVADDASTHAEVMTFLEQLAAEDERIKVAFRDENGHISRASNTALELCSGDWVALMDHDDVLAEHALYHVVRAINRNPAAQLIYSDEDKIGAGGIRNDPYFKCDWNPDLFYSHNMISHLGVYRRDRLVEIGGFREGFEGAQDHDLALRYIERIDPSAICHVPHVLYHWRAHPESTAGRSAAKPYAMTAGVRALQEHFDRRGVPARVERTRAGYRVRYDLPESLPLVSIVIPTRNALPLVKTCVESILGRTTYGHFEILVVDNGSDDPDALAYFSELRQRPAIRIIRDERPFNFARLNNSAISHARGDIIAFVNNDIEVISPEWLSEMVSLSLQPGVGAVGAKLLYPDGSIQHAGVVLGIGGVGGHAFKGQSGESPGYFDRAQIVSAYSALTAACLVIDRELFLQVGGFDENNLGIAFNDVDLCIKVRETGHRNVWTPYARLYHHESATRGYEDTIEKQTRFAAEVRYMQARWGELLLRDPAYNPNLTLEHADFSLAWPPRTETAPSG